MTEKSRIIRINNVKEIFLLKRYDKITKRNLFDVIQYSKINKSTYWSGKEYIIGNTPQQGINWIGAFPNIKAVIIKTRYGSYRDDGWADDKRTVYKYSFKSRKSIISLKEKANLVLINQQQYLYPIYLFIENRHLWVFEGEFFVSEIMDTYVVLQRTESFYERWDLLQDEILYTEGGRRYAMHLIYERNKNIVNSIKSSKPWVCDICNINFLNKYGIKYIEAHHKIPLSKHINKHAVKINDLVLLCPNCHKAVHIYMREENIGYADIKKKILKKLGL